MLKELIPCGMNGMGEWNEPWMDGAFNQSCRESMREALIKGNMSIEVYGKAVVKASKAFIVAWDTALQPTAVPLRGQLSSAQSSELLSTHFMSGSTFILINARIQRWATALILACAAHPTADLRALTSGPSPGWWAFYQSNGFESQAGTPGQGGRRSATHEYVARELDDRTIENAYSIRSATVVISEIVDRFIATDHNEAKLEYERLQDPNSWVAPRNAAIPWFWEVSRALEKFMTRMRRSLTPPDDGTVNADPIDSLFFQKDQNGKSS